jgi:hypothetical protein
MFSRMSFRRQASFVGRQRAFGGLRLRQRALAYSGAPERTRTPAFGGQDAPRSKMRDVQLRHSAHRSPEYVSGRGHYAPRLLMIFCNTPEESRIDRL